MTPQDKRLQTMNMIRKFFHSVNTYLELNELKTKWSNETLNDTMGEIRDAMVLSSAYMYYKDDDNGMPLFVPYKGLWTANDTRTANIELDPSLYSDMERINKSTPLISEIYDENDTITFREVLMYCSSNHPEIYGMYNMISTEVKRNDALSISDANLQYLLATYHMHTTCIDIFNKIIVSPHINELCGIYNVVNDCYDELSLRIMNTLAINACSADMLPELYITDDVIPEAKYALKSLYSSYKLNTMDVDSLSNMTDTDHCTPYMTFKVSGYCTTLIGM